MPRRRARLGRGAAGRRGSARLISRAWSLDCAMSRTSLPCRKPARYCLRASSITSSRVPPPRIRPCSSYSSRTAASPVRTRSDASASHSAANRFGSASCTCSWLRVISESPPPPSGAVSWPSSPSGRNAEPFSAAYFAISRRSAMLVMLDSSASSSVPGLDRDRAECAALALQVAEELRDVVHRVLVAGGLPQDVGGVLAGCQQDHVTLTGVAPHPRCCRCHVSLAGTGRAYDGVAGAVAGHRLVDGGSLGQGQAAGKLPGRLGGLRQSGCL